MSGSLCLLRSRTAGRVSFTSYLLATLDGSGLVEGVEDVTKHPIVGRGVGHPPGPRVSSSGKGQGGGVGVGGRETRTSEDMR